MQNMSIIKHRSSVAVDTVAPKHPQATFSLVSIEAWERFSFYGMQAILAFYLYYAVTEGGLGIEKAHATALIGAYGALVYLCTFAGGWIADNVLGAERTLLYGAGLLVAGHLTLALYHPVAGLAIGLTLIAVGSGSLKTAAITILGAVYGSDEETQRETGFQFFYLGINIAAVLGPLLTGWLAQNYGFHYGFSAAAILMIIGLSIYLAFRRRMFASIATDTQERIRRPATPITQTKALVAIGVGAIVLAAIVVGAATGQIAPQRLATALLIITISIAVVQFITFIFSTRTTEQERKKVIAFIPLFLCSVCFWALLNQTFGVLAVYSDVRLNRMIGSFEVPAAWTQSLNPFFIITLALPVAYFWNKLGNRTPALGTKMSIGVMIASLGYFVFLPFAGGGANSTPFVVLALAVLLISLGELFCGPVGMAVTTSHAPAAFRTQFSALFFLTMAIGTALAGTISGFYNPEVKEAEITYFLSCGIGGLVIAFSAFILAKRLHQELEEPAIMRS